MKKPIEVPGPFQDLRKYPCLVPNNKYPGQSLSENVSNLDSKLIFTWRTFTFFAVDTSFDFFRRFLQTPDDQKNFFEVIPEGPQKLHFDIDISQKDVTDPAHFTLNFAENVKDEVISTIHRYFEKFNEKYKANLPEFSVHSDVLLFKSHRPDKFSYHIVIDNFSFPSSQHCRDVTHQIICRIPNEMSQYIDKSVNKPNQQFRLIWCQKENQPITTRKEFCHEWRHFNQTIHFSPRTFGDHRWNNPSQELHCALYYERALVSHFTREPFRVSFRLPDEFIRKRKFHQDIGDIDTDHLQPMIPEGWSVRDIHDNFVSLKRNSRISCLICKRIHEHENQYLAILTGKQLVFFKCHRKPKMSILLGKLRPEYQESEPNSSQPVQDITRNGISETSSGLITVTPDVKNYIIPASESYTEPFVKPISPKVSEILLVESYLGTGKTTSFINYIRETNPQRVLILSPRRLYAIAITNEYNCDKPHLKPFVGEKFECYLNVDSELTTNRLVLQMESLHKLDLDRPYDVLILDEIEALLSQFQSSTMKLKIKCAETFQYLIRNTPIIIGGDAFLSYRSLLSLRCLKDVKIIRNEHLPIKRKAYEIEDWNSLKIKAIDNLTLGKRIVFVCGSRKKAEEFAAHCQTRNISHKLYTAYQSNMTDELSNINENWVTVQCVIYTSTITVGVNFDVPGYFDQLFVYGTTRGCKARDTIQGTLRVRHLNDNEMYYSIYKVPANLNLPTTIDEIKQRIQLKLSAVDQLTISVSNRPLLTITGENGTSLDIDSRDIWQNCPEWLKYCHIYNVQESNASSKYYHIVFESFLERSNYDRYILIGTNPNKLNNEIDDDIDEYCYESIPAIQSESQYRELIQSKNLGSATRGELLMISKYRFDSLVSPAMPLLSRREFFSMYFGKDGNPTPFFNMRNEKFSTSEEIIQRELNHTYKEMVSDRGLQLDLIKMYNSTLGLENSADEFKIELKDVEIDTILPEYNINEYVDRVFNNPTFAQDPRLAFVRRIKNVYGKWNGCDISYQIKKYMIKGVKGKKYIITKPKVEIWEHLIPFPNQLSVPQPAGS